MFDVFFHVRVKMRGCSCLGMFFQSNALPLLILLGKCYSFGNSFLCLTLLGVWYFFLFLCSCGSAPVWRCDVFECTDALKLERTQLDECFPTSGSSAETLEEVGV